MALADCKRQQYISFNNRLQKNENFYSFLTWLALPPFLAQVFGFSRSLVTT